MSTNAPSNITRNLSAALVGVSVAPEDNTASAAPDREPLQRQSITEINRNRVQENQRILAAQLLMFSLPVMGCLAILLLVLLVAGFVIYVQGWMVMFQTESKPCDQPLKWWLLGMLLVPILQVQLNSHTEAEQRPKKLQALVMPLGIMLGAWMYLHCETCGKTNPELFHYAKTYLIYQFVVWVMMVFMSCGLVSLVFELHRSGLLDPGPGQNSAARAGLIDEIETVRFCPSQFSSSADDDLEPPECPVCSEEFVTDETIKKTICGHYFHEKCLGTWLEQYAKSCPLCRKDLEEAADQQNCGA